MSCPKKETRTARATVSAGYTTHSLMAWGVA